MNSDNSVLPKIAAMRGYFGSTPVLHQQKEKKQSGDFLKGECLLKGIAETLEEVGIISLNFSS